MIQIDVDKDEKNLNSVIQIIRFNFLAEQCPTLGQLERDETIAQQTVLSGFLVLLES